MGFTPADLVKLVAGAVLLGVGFAAGVGLARRGLVLGRELALAGEKLILGPRGALFWQQGHRFSLQTLGVVALTERRLIFRSLLAAREIELPLAKLRGAGDRCLGIGDQRTGSVYLALQPAEGEEFRLVTPGSARWLEEVQARISSPPP